MSLKFLNALIRFSAVAAAVLSFAPNSLKAAEASKLEWHGFMTVAVTASDKDVPYKIDINKTANWRKLSKAGLNATYSVDPNWTAMIQTIAAQRGGENEGLAVDWAMLRYQPTDALSLRLGRQRLAFWLMSDYLDVGHAMPWVTTPDEVYNFNQLHAMDGLSGRYSLGLGPVDLIWEVAGGALKGNVVLTNDNDVRARDLVGTNLSIVAGDYLTLRSSYYQAKVEISNSNFTVPEFQAKYLSYGAKVDYKGLLFIGETASYSEKRDKHELAEAQAAYGAAVAAYKADPTDYAKKVATLRKGAAAQVAAGRVMSTAGWYATLGYRVGKFLPHLTQALWAPHKDSIGVSRQRSETLGVRYDLNPATALKIDLKRVRLADDESGFFLAQAGKKGQKFSKANVASASIDVVF